MSAKAHSRIILAFKNGETLNCAAILERVNTSFNCSYTSGQMSMYLRNLRKRGDCQFIRGTEKVFLTLQGRDRRSRTEPERQALKKPVLTIGVAQISY